MRHYDKHAEDIHAFDIPLGHSRLQGHLSIPEAATGVVIFAHGSGSSRMSPRNRLVALELQQHGLATLLFDLLTPEEQQEDAVTQRFRFDVPRLAERLVMATDQMAREPACRDLAIGYFGASTGAAAALVAAPQRASRVKAIVSRGGRPDLAGHALEAVRAATLLIVGGSDESVLELNREALARMISCRQAELYVVPGATHLFEEPGTLDEAADRAAGWFERHL